MIRSQFKYSSCNFMAMSHRTCCGIHDDVSGVLDVHFDHCSGKVLFKQPLNCTLSCVAFAAEEIELRLCMVTKDDLNCSELALSMYRHVWVAATAALVSC